MFGQKTCGACGGPADFHIEENGPTLVCRPGGCGFAFQYAGRIIRKPDPEILLAAGREGLVLETHGTKELARAMQEKAAADSLPDGHKDKDARKAKAAEKIKKAIETEKLERTTAE